MVIKTFRLQSTGAFRQPGVQLQGHEHCAEQAQGVAQHFQEGLPSHHSPGKLGVGNDVRGIDEAGENVWLPSREKHGPGGVND